MDPQNWNNAIWREHCALPTFVELTRDMSEYNVFTIFDANKGFWPIELIKAEWMLTTFATRYGRYRCCRHPYGISFSAEIFYRIYTEIFDGGWGEKNDVDEIIIYSSGMQKPKKARIIAVKFYKAASKFLVKEVKYLGHIMSEKGIKMNRVKKGAIEKISR